LTVRYATKIWLETTNHRRKPPDFLMSLYNYGWGFA
jgi:hypothetical protein